MNFLKSILSLFVLIFLIGCAATSPTGKDGSVAALPWVASSNIKIGYIRSDEISQKYPDYKDADNTLKIENKKWLDEAAEMESKIRQKETELAEISLILSEERRAELEKELTKLRSDLQKFRSDTWYSENSTYIKRRKELMAPIDARVNDAIYKVSESKNLDLVFDTIAGNIVYAKEGLDITNLVLEELQK